jgi:hypothetical protein
VSIRYGMASFESLILAWADSAAGEWGYPPLPDGWLGGVLGRLPGGLRVTLSESVERGVILVQGHSFTLAGLTPGKGPYAFFSRSSKGVPAPNWEYFVQAAEYGRLRAAVEGRGYRVDFEDDLMDVSVYDPAGQLLWCIEVKEKAKDLESLLTGIRNYGHSLDSSIPDRHNDALRKAKYLLRQRPPYFSLVAIGRRLDFSVSYDQEGFVLVEDLVPIA